MRALAHTLCLATLQGYTFWCTPAWGQGFTRRYDLIATGEPQVAYAIEMVDQHALVLGASYILLQNGYYYSTVVSCVLNLQGEIACTDSIIVTDHYLYPGNWNSMSQRADGGFVAGGSTIVEDGTKRFALMKINTVGMIEYVGEYGSVGEEWIGRQAIECKDGGFLMVGETGEFGVIDGMLIKTDSSGVVEWQRNYGGPWRDYMSSVDTTAGEGYFVGGSFRVAENDLQQWVVRINAIGDTVWTRTWGSEFLDAPARITTKSNGNVVTASTWNYAPNSAATQAYMAELDQYTGEFIWERWYGPVLNYTTLRVAKEISPGDGHIAAGMAFAENSNFWQGLLLRTTDNGDSLWMRRYFYYDDLMTDGMGELNDVVPTPDGGFIACGFTQGSYTGPYPPGYSQDVWVVKVDSLGCIEPGCNIPLGITTQITNLRHALPVFPNPVPQGGQVTVQVALPEGFRKEPLRLSVVSADGRLVEELDLTLRSAEASREGDSHTSQLTLHTSTYASGLYHLHLTSGTTWLSGAKLVVE